jgi:glycosyltransferase involved in cell wall biosynthesis
MPKVSVIVPVYNPGAHIEGLIASLLAQTLPREELELVLVDDGSDDGTPARLDALAAEHPHVRVRHIPNSGWPGRPRNVGLGLARGDFVFFADNDDRLEQDALERLHAAALLDDADVVMGKVVGHGRRVNRSTFRRSVHGEPFESISLLGLLTPHKLFRRAFLEQHGLRFPEGRRRLEDHPFVVDAYFRARRISVLADRPYYHWVRRRGGASYDQWDPEGYFENLREVLDLVEARTEPGAWRERLLAHWYRGKMLNRVGGDGWLRRDARWRRELFEAVRALALERFGDDVHERMGFNLRMRSQLLRRGDYETLELLARFETRLKAHVKLRWVRERGTHLAFRLESRIGGSNTPLRFERRGERVLWLPPERFKAAIGEEERDVTEELARSAVTVHLRDVAGGAEYLLPARTRVVLQQGSLPGRVRPKLVTTVPVAPTAAAAGFPLPPATWEVRAQVSVVGFADGRKVRRASRPLLLTTYPPGRIVAGDRAPEPPSLRRRLTRAAAGAAARG